MAARVSFFATGDHAPQEARKRVNDHEHALIAFQSNRVIA
jgi:hypothetical protein